MKILFLNGKDGYYFLHILPLSLEIKAMIMEYIDEKQTKWEVLCHQYIKNKRTKRPAT